MNLSLLKRPLIIYLILLGIILVIWDGILQLQPVKTALGNYVFNAGYGIVFISGAGIGWQGLRRLGMQTTIGKTIAFLSIALFSYGLGQFLWVSYNLFTNTAIPYPSLADIFFILFIPLIGLSVFYSNKMFLTTVPKRLVFESLLIPVIPGIVIFMFLSRPDISEHLSLLTRFFNLAYPLGDTILISLGILILRVAGGKIYAGMSLLIAGLFMQAGADLLFAYRTSEQLYWNGDISDVLFAISGFLFCLSIITLLDEFSASS